MVSFVTVCPPGEVPNVGVPARLARDMTIAEQQQWLQVLLRGRRVSRRSALKGGDLQLAAPKRKESARSTTAGEEFPARC